MTGKPEFEAESGLKQSDQRQQKLQILFLVFDEAALTDDLLVQLVEALKKHKESINKNKESETAEEKEKEASEGTLQDSMYCP